VLVVNDHVLKPLYHNWVTGKLSDFAGLAAFGLFWCIMFPAARRVILVATAVVFAYWKSPAADSLVTLLNDALPFSVGRAPDITDLVAITALLPVAYLTRGEQFRFGPRRRLDWVVVPVAFFAFVATEETLPTEANFREEYSFSVAADSLKQLIRTSSGSSRLAQEHAEYFQIRIPWTCPLELRADTRVLGTDTRSSLWLDRLWSDCDKDGWSAARMQRLFEDSVIKPLQARLLGQ
jgi:hypothetical protein